MSASRRADCAFLHRSRLIGHERLVPTTHQSARQPFESAIAARISSSGCARQAPKLVVCLPQRAAPSVARWPLNRAGKKRTDLKHVERSPIEYLRRFYYDTVATPTTYSNIWSR